MPWELAPPACAVRWTPCAAGYGPCLAATLTLHKSKLLPEDTPGKVSAVAPWHVLLAAGGAPTGGVCPGRSRCHRLDTRRTLSVAAALAASAGGRPPRQRIRAGVWRGDRPCAGQHAGGGPGAAGVDQASGGAGQACAPACPPALLPHRPPLRAVASCAAPACCRCRPPPRRQHLYGDVYSSPGLGLRQKQLLTCAFLAEAAMPDQLFGHALAGLRWGPAWNRHPRCSCACLVELRFVNAAADVVLVALPHPVLAARARLPVPGSATATPLWRRRRGWPATWAPAPPRARPPHSSRR